MSGFKGKSMPSGKKGRAIMNRRKGSFLFFAASIVVVVLTAAMLWYLVEHKKSRIQNEAKDLEAAVEAGPFVRFVTTSSASHERKIELLGEARPYTTATLYAKVSGYLSRINVDKGDKVKAKQVLAVIDSPETDRQYEAAVADAKNKRADAKRLWTVMKSNGVSRETAENAEAAAQVAEATASSLLAQKNYEIIRAPFTGIVTARFADPGALVQSATSAQTSALPIVTVSETDRLRIFVYLDQKNAGLVRVGDKAEVSDPTRRHVKLSASVSRTSVELDSRTRTLLTELDLKNRQGAIMPGSFVQVALVLHESPSVEVSAQALVIRGGNPFLCILGDDNKVSFRPVKISYSDGRVVRLNEGVKEGERVVLNAGESLTDGAQVQPVMAHSN